MNIEEGNRTHAVESRDLRGTAERECSLVVEVPPLSLDRLLSRGVRVRPAKYVEYAIEVLVFEGVFLECFESC